jgi:hypothetical protein
MARKKAEAETKPKLKKRSEETKSAVKVKTKGKKEELRVPILTEEMIEEIQNEILDLQENMSKAFRFNASAKRARKNTTNLQKMFKIFRASSIEHWKKQN